MTPKLILPPLPFGAAEATVRRWLKREGEPLAAGEPLLIVLSERAEVALPAPAEGVLEARLLAEGASATPGTALARIARAAPQRNGPRVTPVARRIAAEAGLEVAALSGSAPGGRICKRDVLAAIQPAPPAQTQFPALAPSPAPAAGVVLPHDAIPWALVAVEADLAAVEAALAASNTRRGPAAGTLAGVALAALGALQRFPLLNATWQEEYIVARRRVHLRVRPAGGEPRTIADAQDLNLRGLARALARPATPGEAPAPTFTIAELREATIPLGRLGEGAGATLGIGRVQRRPVVVAANGAERLAIRPTAILALSYDARVVEQRMATDFLIDLQRALAVFRG